MPAQAQSVQKVIVIPRQLEDYFLERLSRVYEGREDVRVVVDRAQAVIVSRENGWI